jgi:hypothetical protein
VVVEAVVDSVVEAVVVEVGIGAAGVVEVSRR